jgi:hypothetical protein
MVASKVNLALSGLPASPPRGEDAGACSPPHPHRSRGDDLLRLDDAKYGGPRRPC